MRCCRLALLLEMPGSCFSSVPSQIVVYAPFHIWMSSPFEMTSLPVSKLFHIQELPSRGFTFKSDSFLQYFGRRVEATTNLGSVLILHACFLRRALFISTALLIPNPPLVLSKHKVSQLFKCSFLAPISCPHQKLLTI